MNEHELEEQRRIITEGFDRMERAKTRPQLNRVEIIDRPPDATFEYATIEVRPYWRDVDRPYTGGWLFQNTPRKRRIAQRLRNAILDGAAIQGEPRIAVDVTGSTYVQVSFRVLARTANADLHRIGF